MKRSISVAGLPSVVPSSQSTRTSSGKFRSSSLGSDTGGKWADQRRSGGDRRDRSAPVGAGPASGDTDPPSGRRAQGLLSMGKVVRSERDSRRRQRPRRRATSIPARVRHTSMRREEGGRSANGSWPAVARDRRAPDFSTPKRSGSHSRSPGESRRCASRARSAAADAPYRCSIERLRHPANIIRSPSLPPSASQRCAKVCRN